MPILYFLNSSAVGWETGSTEKYQERKHVRIVRTQVRIFLVLMNFKKDLLKKRKFW